MLLLLLILMTAQLATAHLVPASDGAFEYAGGRWDTGVAGRARTSWAGSYVKFTVTLDATAPLDEMCALDHPTPVQHDLVYFKIQ